MFKFLPRNPESPRSVVAAGFRLYFASFKYALAFSIMLSAALSIVYTGFESYTQMSDFFVQMIASFVGLVFFIPLVKRIFSVGAGFPISTRHAYAGFFSHYVRVMIIICLFAFLSIFIVLAMNAATINVNLVVFTAFASVIIYTYIALKLYFAYMFVILENQHIFDAFKNSMKIEAGHMWLTFWVLFGFGVSLFIVITFISPWLSPSLYVQIGFNAAIAVVAIPLFLCVQICQFFNLKELSRK